METSISIVEIPANKKCEFNSFLADNRRIFFLDYRHLVSFAISVSIKAKKIAASHHSRMDWLIIRPLIAIQIATQPLGHLH